MRIGIDLDGVVADFYGYAIDRNKAMEVAEALINGPTHHWYTAVDSYIKELASVPETYLNLKEVKNSVSNLNLLHENGFEISYITSRPENSGSATLTWMENHKLPQRDTLYFSDDKASTCRTLNIECYVEDRPPVAEDIYTKSRTSVYLLETPYNRWYKTPLRGIKVVHCWDDVAFFLMFYRDKRQ